jgi:hypothetical protein
MHWSLIDVCVVILFLAQLIALIYVTSIVLSIKNGPVFRLRNLVMPLVARGKAMAATLPNLVARLTEQSKALGSRGKSIRSHFHVQDQLPGQWLSPRSLRQGFSALTMLRGAMASRAATSKKKKGRSIPERLGLVPPIAKHLGPVLRGARTAIRVARGLKPK